MKNLSLALNAVLLVAVGVLYFLHFSSKTSDAKDGTNTELASIENAEIVYINSDTLLSNYSFYDQIRQDLEEEKNKLEKEFSNRAGGLEKEFANFQKNAPSMTMAQGRAREEELMKKRENLVQYQQSLQQTLMVQESNATNELYDKVAEYLKRFSEEHNYQLVLTYTKGSGVLYGSEKLDVTQNVLLGLNDEYDTQINASTTPSDSVNVD